MNLRDDDSEQLDETRDREAYYPPVMEPSPSKKKKREEELEKDREEKIKKGFYQVNYILQTYATP